VEDCFGDRVLQTRNKGQTSKKTRDGKNHDLIAFSEAVSPLRGTMKVPIFSSRNNLQSNKDRTPASLRPLTEENLKFQQFFKTRQDKKKKIVRRKIKAVAANPYLAPIISPTNQPPFLKKAPPRRHTSDKRFDLKHLPALVSFNS